jgi:hypothetical protein
MRCLTRSLAACLALWMGTAAAQGEGRPRLHFLAEYFYRSEYATLPGHKSLAFSESGGFGYAFNGPDGAAAEKLALAQCNDRARSWVKKGETPKPCETLMVDAEPRDPGLLSGTDWQREAQGPDRPLKKGMRQLLPRGKAKGIIIHVHGCDGIGDKDTIAIWADYFNALGYDFHAPSSFADKRPKEICGKLSDHPASQLSAVIRLRISQTLRTVATLRKQRPGAPIYLWGHSEGGVIVQLVKAEVAGIIVTGEECGAYGSPVAAPDHVPFLYLLGQYDPYVDGLGVPVSPKSESICAALLGRHRMIYRVVPNATHNPYPWHSPTSELLPQFLGASPVAVAPADNAAKAKAAWKRQRPWKQYRAGKPNRMVAATPRRFIAITGAKDLDEGKEYVVFLCNKAVSRKSNVFISGRHLCSLVDVNGTPER